MKTADFDHTVVDILDLALVGGTGTFEEVAAHLVNAVEAYNALHGTSLILGVTKP